MADTRSAHAYRNLEERVWGRVFCVWRNVIQVMHAHRACHTGPGIWWERERDGGWCVGGPLEGRLCCEEGEGEAEASTKGSIG